MSVVPDAERLKKGISDLWKVCCENEDGGTGKRAEEVIIVFWYDHNMGWWGYAGMGIGMVLFWALVVAGIVVLVVMLSGDRRTQQPPPTPEQILGARYARGEISEREYRDRLAVLRDPARQ
jgi:putative membrane protein